MLFAVCCALCAVCCVPLGPLQVSIDANGLLKVTHMVPLGGGRGPNQGPGAASMQPSALSGFAATQVRTVAYSTMWHTGFRKVDGSGRLRVQPIQISWRCMHACCVVVRLADETSWGCG